MYSPKDLRTRQLPDGAHLQIETRVQAPWKAMEMIRIFLEIRWKRIIEQDFDRIHCKTCCPPGLPLCIVDKQVPIYFRTRCRTSRQPDCQIGILDISFVYLQGMSTNNKSYKSSNKITFDHDEEGCPFRYGFKAAYMAKLIGVGIPCSPPRRTTVPFKTSSSRRRPAARS